MHRQLRYAKANIIIIKLLSMLLLINFCMKIIWMKLFLGLWN